MIAWARLISSSRDADVLLHGRIRGVDDLAEIVERVHDDAERVADLVRNAGRQLADRRHLLRLDELALQALAR